MNSGTTSVRVCSGQSSSRLGLQGLSQSLNNAALNTETALTVNENDNDDFSNVRDSEPN